LQENRLGCRKFEEETSSGHLGFFETPLAVEKKGEL
jgi:hypothetical protein